MEQAIDLLCDITYKAELTQPQFEIKDANRQIRAG